MPWIIWAGLGLIGWRAADHAGEALGDEIGAALPYMAAGLVGLIILKKVV
jgi:hypothetical protein